MVHQPPAIVATLGPASWSLAPALLSAGATRFRINASHLDSADLDRVLIELRRVLPDAPVVVDLQGAKMRLGAIAPREVTRGQRLRFACDSAGGESLPHRELFLQVRRGDTLSIDDGRVQLQVDECDGMRMEATALNDGRLLPRKGVNLVQHPVVLDALTESDRAAVATARRHGVGEFAFSFMLTGDEASWLRAEAPACRVVGKIERREAADAIVPIASRVDAIWICRGDLGVQLGAAGLARFVAKLSPSDLGVPVLMAGQVLEHLTRHREPTRSEVCHVFDLVERGYRGVVLSDETAIGDDPVKAVEAATSLLRAFHSLNTAG